MDRPDLVSAAGPVHRSVGSENPNERTLVLRAREGDRAAFDRLHERYCRMVHAIAVANGAARLADDVEQEVFLAAWRHLGTLRSDDHFGGWLAQIARHRARRTIAGVRAHEAPLEHDIADRSAAPGESAATDVLTVLRTLPESYRETLALRLIEGLSGPEIAELTGMTHGSVRVNLTRGMEKLRAALTDRGWTA